MSPSPHGDAEIADRPADMQPDALTPAQARRIEAAERQRRFIESLMQPSVRGGRR